MMKIEKSEAYPRMCLSGVKSLPPQALSGGQKSSRQHAAGSMELLLVAYCLLLALFSGCAAAPPATKNSEPDMLYAKGLTLYQDGNYDGAIAESRKIVEDYPLSPVAADAELLLADAYYAGGQYSDSAAYYANFVALHPGHPKAPYALFQKGMSYFRDVRSIDRDQTSDQKALLAFGDLISMYPESIYVDKAKDMTFFLKSRLAEREFYIGKFYYKDKKYKGALARFAEVLKKYPDAGLSDKTLYYIGISYIQLGEKELARDAFSTLVANFPNSSFAADAKEWLKNNQEG